MNNAIRAWGFSLSTRYRLYERPIGPRPAGTTGVASVQGRRPEPGEGRHTTEPGATRCATRSRPVDDLGSDECASSS